MGKINYLIKRITRMSYKKMFETIDLVHKKTKKNKLSIFIDIVYCGLKYEAGYVDYNLFEMYKLNKYERSTIITRGINNKILKKSNNLTYAYIFEDKALFNKLYDKYLNRDWLFLKDNESEFNEFIKNKDYIMVKPLSLSCGKGVEKIKLTKETKKGLYQKLINNKQTLVEEVAIQHKDINDIYPESINTIRIVTLNKHVVAAFIRFGNKGNVVDNFNHEGMVTTINIDTGIVEYPAIDKKGNVYKIHPYTNKEIIGLHIPYWKDVKKLCIEACDITPEIGYIGWDVCVGESKPFIIEGNDFPGHDLYQLPVHRKNGIGLLPIFEKAMEEKMKIAIATDHNGVNAKKEIIRYLLNKGYEVEDCSKNNTNIDDYPDFAFEVSKYVVNNNALGILMCGTGIGMSIAANKVKGIRCAHVTNPDEARLAKEHNNANIIALSYKTNINELENLINIFLNTNFSNEERHVRRINKITKYESD